MENQLVDILEKTTSINQHELTSARTFLETAMAGQYEVLAVKLSEILAGTGFSPVVRMQAGLQLKNVLYSNDVEQKSVKQARWLSMPAEMRNIIKMNCFTALGTEEQGYHSTSQCVAQIACTEIPVGQWNEVIDLLMTNVTNAGSLESLKQSSLECIGYICSDIDPTILAGQADKILTGIVCGMKPDEPSNRVRLAATQAMLNSLEFTQQNFRNEHERNYIMQVICETTQSPDQTIVVVALQCLVKIMSNYYQFMEMYMQRALFAITLEAIQSTNDFIVLQGIEFWSTVSEEEIELAIEAEELRERGVQPAVISKYYARGALKYLTPVLLTILEKQEDGEDEDEWNPNKAAGVCLSLLAQACEESIVELVLPYVEVNITSDDWRRRDAAIMSFGSILEGPSTASLSPLVRQAMPVIINLLADPVSVVRDTAAWTVGKVCEVLPEVPLGDVYLQTLLQAMIQALASEPRVATNVCWALSSLAEGAYDVEIKSHANLDGDGNNVEPHSFKLSPYFSNIVQQLLTTTNRNDCGQSNLRNAAYNALMSMMKHAPRDCYQYVQQTTVVVLNNLNNILEMEQAAQLSREDRMQLEEYQSLLCGTLQSILRKFDRGDALKISTNIMQVVMIMFARAQVATSASSSSNSSRCTGVQEDALLAVSALIDAIGQEFTRYLPDFMPVLVQCLRNHGEYQICSNSIGILGDLARNVNAALVPYLDTVFQMLDGILRSPSTQKTLLPQIISTFGDFALQLGDCFHPYRDSVLLTLKEAIKAEVDMNDPDMVDYLNQLRNSCIETYVGLIQGAVAANVNVQENQQRLAFIWPHIEQYIISFVMFIGAQEVSSDDLIGSCCGLIGDIISGFAHQALPLLEQEHITSLLNRGRNLKNPALKKYAVWATKELRKLRPTQ